MSGSDSPAQSPGGKVRISVLGINYEPELTGIAVYTTDMCEFLVEKGHDVRVTTGFPYYPSWEIPAKYSGRLYANESASGVVIRRCYLYVHKNITPIKRIIHEASFLISSFFSLCFSRRSDVMIVISPPLGLGLVAYVVCRFKRMPFVFHIQDMQPDAAIDLGMLKNEKIITVLRWLEKTVYKNADYISTISNSMMRKLVEKSVPAKKMRLFRNWMTVDNIPEAITPKEFRERHGLIDKFVFLYSGNIGEKQGLEQVIHAAARISDGRIQFVISGNGANMAKLKRLADDMNVENVLFIDLQPKEYLGAMLKAADVCLVVQKEVMSSLVFPSKLMNIMMAGRPSVVTATTETELGRVIVDSESGYLCDPENPDRLLEALLVAYGDKRLLEKGCNAYRYALQHFSRNGILHEFNEFLLKVAEM